MGKQLGEVSEAADTIPVSVILPGAESIGPFWVSAATRRQIGGRFSELPRATVEAAPTERLREVLGRAGDSLGIRALDYAEASVLRSRRRLFRAGRSWAEVKSDPRSIDSSSRFEEALYFAAFVLPGDEQDGPALLADKRHNLRRVTVVSADGRARWGVLALEATIPDLLRSADAGLIDGDPLRPYLVVAVPGGDPGGFGIDWQAFVGALKLFGEVVFDFGAAWSAYEGFLAIRRRLSGARSVLGRHQADWSERGARPRDLGAILGARPRYVDEVASLLGCQKAEAEALLWGLGFTEGVDRRWRPADDPPGEVLGLARDLASRGVSPSPDDLRREVEALLRRLESSQGPRDVLGAPGPDEHQSPTPPRPEGESEA